MRVEKVPDATYEMIGGLDKQIQEIKEVIELPIKHPELFEALGIAQPQVGGWLLVWGGLEMKKRSNFIIGGKRMEVEGDFCAFLVGKCFLNLFFFYSFFFLLGCVVVWSSWDREDIVG